MNICIKIYIYKALRKGDESQQRLSLFLFSHDCACEYVCARVRACACVLVQTSINIAVILSAAIMERVIITRQLATVFKNCTSVCAHCYHFVITQKALPTKGQTYAECRDVYMSETIRYIQNGCCLQLILATGVGACVRKCKCVLACVRKKKDSAHIESVNKPRL